MLPTLSVFHYDNAMLVPGDSDIKFDGNIRLCWAWEDEWKLEEGIKRIGHIAKKMLEEGEKEGEPGWITVRKMTVEISTDEFK